MPKRKKPNRVKKSHSLRLPLLFIGLGLFLLTIPSIFYLNQTIQLRFFTPKLPQPGSIVKNASRKPLPTHLSIPYIHVSLPLGETSLRNNSWEIYKDGVSHLDISSRPGENGPIILYAHNTLNRFGSLPYLKKGEQITITASDGKAHTYSVIQTLEADPNRVDLFERSDETLILYTCTGFADLKRFVVVALPTSSEIQKETE